MDEWPEGNDMWADRNKADFFVLLTVGAETLTTPSTFDMLAHNDSA